MFAARKLTVALSFRTTLSPYASQVSPPISEAPASTHPSATPETIAAIHEAFPKAEIYVRAFDRRTLVKLKNGQFDESIVGKRACDCREDPEKWYTKKTLNPEHIHAVAETALIPLLIRAMDERPRKYKIYQSADLTLRHLSQLRLLGSIEQKVRNLNDEANRFFDAEILGDVEEKAYTRDLFRRD